MILQAAISEIVSRDDCNPYLDNGNLPLITAPMSSVVNEDNYEIFISNKINVCLPRTIDTIFWEDNIFIAMSLNDFIEEFLERTESFLGKRCVCIDTANGNMQILHEAIIKAKEQHGDNLIIMAGNVGSLNAFNQLALTGCDYIRVGIGGGCLAACTRILMANGIYKNITDVLIGDFVINKDGNPVKVINTLYSGKKKVSKIKHNVFYNPLVITNDHQVRISDLSLYKKSSISSKGYKAFFKKDTWKPISESTKDNLLSPIKINYQLPIDFNINLNQFDSNKSKNKVGNIKPSYELGYIFGTFLGDGNINVREDFYVKRNSINKTGCVQWAFGKNENLVTLNLIKYIKNIFKEKSNYKKEKNIIQITLYRKWAAQLFSEFYTKEGIKYLPNKWYCLNNNYLQGLYDGLIDSDGYRELTRDCFENTSSYLIELIYFIKSNLQGYFPNTEQRKKTCGKLKNCNENNLKQSYSLRTLSNYLKRQVGNFNLLKITSFENNIDEVDTYDIVVDCPTHSFIANNCIVHNSGCNTSNNVGVGCEDLGSLIYKCYNSVQSSKKSLLHWKSCIDEPDSNYYKKNPEVFKNHLELYNKALLKSKVKIIADGISDYVKQCQDTYGFNDNGYAAINKLLWLGANLVMIGSLFSQTVESAAEKYIKVNEHYSKISQEELEKQTNLGNVYSKYYGMSSFVAQEQYRPSVSSYNEGSVKYLPIKYYLSEWLYGSPTADYYPYLSGWVNSIKSAMSYTNSFNLNQFNTNGYEY